MKRRGWETIERDGKRRSSLRRRDDELLELFAHDTRVY